METSLGINQAMIPLDRTTPLTSIENRTEIIEKDPLLTDENKHSRGSNRTKVGDGRYSVSSSSSLIKSNFYAIHHSFHLDENNNPHSHQQQKQKQQEQEKAATTTTTATTIVLSSPSSSSSSSSSTASPPSTAALLTAGEVPLPSTPQQAATPPPSTTTTLSTDVTNQISRKRLTPDPTTETYEIIGAVSPSPATTTTTIVESNDNKRKKVRQQLVKHRKPDSHSLSNNNTSQEYCLYKSCSSIWPGSSHSLGELSHQNITELSNLFKIRLCQAKFKMMATLDQENGLFDFLNDEYVPPQPKILHTIQLPKTHNQSTMSVVGNGKNLFRRYIKKNQINNSNNSINKNSTLATSTIKENGNNENASSSGGKKYKQNSQSGKTKRISKRKSLASDIPSIVLSDGTKVYVCEPCGKKYKNRNGLTYHLERCKNKVKKEEPTKLLNCICSQPSNQYDNTSLIQCEKCRSLLHTECMGLTSDVSTHSGFICPHCKDDSKHQEHQQHQEDVNTQKTVSTVVSKPSPLLDDLHIADDEESIRTEEHGTQTDKMVDLGVSNNSSNNNNNNNSNNSNSNDPSNNSLHVWDDFSFSSALDKMFEPWSMLSEEEPFSSQLDPTDIPSQWNVNNVLNQPPSLLFSDATLSSTLEDDSVMMSSELTPLPISENTPPTTSALMSDPSTIINNTVNTPTQHSTDGLWFQFANFDDDYQCEQ